MDIMVFSKALFNQEGGSSTKQLGNKLLGLPSMCNGWAILFLDLV